MALSVKEKDEMLFRAVEELKSGNTEDVNLVYELSEKYVYKIIYDIVKDHYTTEDLMQESFIQIYNNIASLQDARAFYVWAGRIATNMTLRYIQKNRHEVLPEADENGDTDFVFENAYQDTESFIPETILMDREKQRLIAEIIDRLSVEQKLSIQYFYYEEFSVKEIAQMMNCSEGTVKSRLNYARKSIKEAVIDLEVNENTRLYSLATMPLFWLIFKLSVEYFVIPTAAVAAGGAAVAGGAGVAASTSGSASAAVAGGAGVSGGASAAVEAVSANVTANVGTGVAMQQVATSVASSSVAVTKGAIASGLSLKAATIGAVAILALGGGGVATYYGIQHFSESAVPPIEEEVLVDVPEAPIELEDDVVDDEQISREKFVDMSDAIDGINWILVRWAGQDLGNLTYSEVDKYCTQFEGFIDYYCYLMWGGFEEGFSSAHELFMSSFDDKWEIVLNSKAYIEYFRGNKEGAKKYTEDCLKVHEDKGRTLIRLGNGEFCFIEGGERYNEYGVYVGSLNYPVVERDNTGRIIRLVSDTGFDNRFEYDSDGRLKSSSMYTYSWENGAYVMHAKSGNQSERVEINEYGIELSYFEVNSEFEEELDKLRSCFEEYSNSYAGVGGTNGVTEKNSNGLQGSNLADAGYTGNASVPADSSFTVNVDLPEIEMPNLFPEGEYTLEMEWAAKGKKVNGAATIKNIEESINSAIQAEFGKRIGLASALSYDDEINDFVLKKFKNEIYELNGVSYQLTTFNWGAVIMGNDNSVINGHFAGTVHSLN